MFGVISGVILHAELGWESNINLQDSLTGEINTDQIASWASTTGIVIAVILVGAWVLQKFGMSVITKIVRRNLRRDKFATPGEELQREQTLTGIIGASFNVVVAVIAGFLILAALGINIMPLFAGAGLVAVALGFGAQSMVKDFLSGGFIIIENQYRVGDIVEINGKSGKVQRVTMRETVLRDVDGNVHHIPNGEIKLATNKTIEYSRINLEVVVELDTDIDKLEKVINDVGVELAKDVEWKHKIIDAPKFERIDGFLNYGLKIMIWGKCQPMKQWSVTGELRRRLLKAFDKHRIKLAYPHSVVHTGRR